MDSPTPTMATPAMKSTDSSNKLPKLGQIDTRRANKDDVAEMHQLLKANKICFYNIDRDCLKGDDCPYGHDSLASKGLNAKQFLGFYPDPRLLSMNADTTPELPPDPDNTTTEFTPTTSCSVLSPPTTNQRFPHDSDDESDDDQYNLPPTKSWR